MGCLKLSVLEEQKKEEKNKLKVYSPNTKKVSACSCPCWAFIRKGASVIVDDDIQVTASWNID